MGFFSPPTTSEERMLLDAYETKDLEKFEECVSTLGTFNPVRVVSNLIAVEYDDHRFIRALFSHGPTTVNIGAAGYLLQNISEFENEYDIIDALIARVEPKTPDTMYELVCTTDRLEKVKLLERVLREALKECPLLSMVDLSWFLYLRLSSKEDPIAFLHACVNAGVDMSRPEFHFILANYLMHGKIVPGLARELIKYGIPKKAAYVSVYLKSPRYRSRMVSELPM